MKLRWSVAVAVAGGLMAVEMASVAAQGVGPAAPEAVPVIDEQIARQLIMTEIEHLVGPMDIFAATGQGDLDALRVAAGQMSTLFGAFPHLFSTASNTYDDPNAQWPTIALPVIWEDFGSFYQAANYAASVALTASQAATAEEFAAAAVNIRAACDGCHQQYIEVYVSPFDLIAPAPQ